MVPPDPIDESARSSKGRMMERRKRLFECLVVACAVTLVAGFVPSFRVMLWLNLVSDLMLAGFIYFLLSDKKSRSARTDEPDAQESDDYFDEQYLRAGQL